MTEDSGAFKTNSADSRQISVFCDLSAVPFRASSWNLKADFFLELKGRFCLWPVLR
jgi:hypothetical protein